MKNSLFSVPVILTYLALFLLMSFTSDSTKEQKDVKYFTLKKGDSPMTSEVKSKLTAAYKAQYGKKSVIESIKLEEINGATWLVFNSGSNSNPTVA